MPYIIILAKLITPFIIYQIKMLYFPHILQYVLYTVKLLQII